MMDVERKYISLRAAIFCLLAAVLSSPLYALDKAKYITVDEIKPGMKAYCLTVLQGTEVKKHDLEVISVIEDFKPGIDGIAVMGISDEFKRYNSIQGCSGSPVYIDGRMAGALARGWGFSREPLYIVTPIEYMLAAGVTKPQTQSQTLSTIQFDFSNPVNLSAFTRQYSDSIMTMPLASGSSLLPIMTSLPEHICEQLNKELTRAGLQVRSTANSTYLQQQKLQSKIEPGGVIAIPIVYGDISLAAIGTVTEVVGKKVYALGHSFLGQGKTDLPMATGYIHTIVSHLGASFKLGSSGTIQGAVQFDETSGVMGTIGETAKTFPLKLTVNHFADAEIKTYNCRMAVNRFYTPLVLKTVIIGTATMKAKLPPEHSIRYSFTLDIEGYEPLTTENVSSQSSFSDVLDETSTLLAVLMNNPFKEVQINGIEITMDIQPVNDTSRFYSIHLSDSTVSPGDSIDMTVILENFRAEKKLYKTTITLPEDLPKETYDLEIMGSYPYTSFLQQIARHNYMAYDIDSMVAAIRRIISIKKNMLYIAVKLPPSGITVDNQELADLPMTKAALFQNDKRTAEVIPMNHWYEKRLPIETIVEDRHEMKIIVD